MRSLELAIKHLAGDRLQGTAAERTALSGNTLGSIAQTSWKELDRVTLGSAADVLDTGTFAAKDNLMILLWVDASTAPYGNITFNGDTGSNYARRYCSNGASDTTHTSQSGIYISSGGAMNHDYFVVLTIRNTASAEKLVICHSLEQDATGATSPNRVEIAAKWANTANQITRVELTNSRSGHDFASGSEMVILGCDDDEADSGTNFWQELSNTTTTVAANNINSGTITAKKWLMVDCHIIPTTNDSNTTIICNGDTAQGSYSMRRSYDGGNESTYAGTNPIGSTAGMYTGFGENRTNLLMNTMIANVSGKEKLMFWHMSHALDGATNEPHRTEGVGKWHTTSGQITNFKIQTSTGSHYGANSRMRVWGSD